jgi:hypothetical protein
MIEAAVFRPGPPPAFRNRRFRAAFGAVALVQAFHTGEHLAVLYQRYVLHQAEAEGFLGRWLDFEWVHFTFNLALSALLLLLFLGYRMDRPEWRRESATGWWAMVGAVVVEVGLHLPEHVVRMVQYLRWGWNPAPGILGHTATHGSGPFDVVLLHTAYNAAVAILLLVAYAGLVTARAGVMVAEPAR